MEGYLPAIVIAVFLFRFLDWVNRHGDPPAPPEVRRCIYSEVAFGVPVCVIYPILLAADNVRVGWTDISWSIAAVLLGLAALVVAHHARMQRPWARNVLTLICVVRVVFPLPCFFTLHSFISIYYLWFNESSRPFFAGRRFDSEPANSESAG